MRVNVSSRATPPIAIDSLSTGDTFEFEGHQYMKIRLSCAGLSAPYQAFGGRNYYPYDPRLSCCGCNLKSGTIRLIDRFQLVSRTKAVVDVEVM